MPTWVIGILEWAVGLVLQHVSAADVKTKVADIFATIDASVQAAEKTNTGPFKGLGDEVCVAFHEACVAIVAALKQ